MEKAFRALFHVSPVFVWIKIRKLIISPEYCKAQHNQQYCKKGTQLQKNNPT
jgi:hypothetical protein